MSPVPATRPLIRTLFITAICILLIALSLVLTRRQQARNSSFKSARNHSSVDLFDPDKGRITPEATTIVVNTLSDAANGSDGLCTLREAITAANNNVPSGAVAGECAAGSSVTSDTIDLTAISGTISLNNGLFPINSDLSINGLGPGSLTIQRSTNPGTPGFRIFMINSGRSVSINGLTLGNGLTGVNEDGGAINNGGTLTMTNCNLFGNTATPSRGGAIYSNGASVTLNNCQIGGTSPGQANTSGAGAIYGPNITMVGGSVVGNVGVGLQLTNGNNLISGVAITDNIGALDGGGIETFPFGTVKIVNSLIANNTAARRGGGIDSLTTMTIVNSTISGNRSAAAGGGINGGGLTLVNVTVTNNRCDSDNNGGEQGGGLNSSGDLTNTLIAGNFRGSSPSSTADDATGNLLTGSNNLIGAGGSGGLVNGVNNNQVGVIDPKIGPLSNNGGSLQTHALLAGSPALDAGSNAAITSPTFSGPPFTDQRGTGFDRISDGNADATATVDIGAFEAQKIVVTNTNDSGAGSLRQAILDANANPGADTITFNIPGAGVHTITPASLLPAITDQVLVDGYTQPGASRNTLASGDNAVLLIELDGTVIAGSSGLTIRASNCELRGLVINRFAQGIFITSSSGTTQTTGNLIQGNFIGTNASGNSSLPNSEGILIQSSNHDQIGGTTPDARNVIAGNAARGVNLSSFSSATMIQGNFIGTNASGKALVNPFSTATGILSGGSGSDIIGCDPVAPVSPFGPIAPVRPWGPCAPCAPCGP